MNEHIQHSRVSQLWAALLESKLARSSDENLQLSKKILEFLAGDDLHLSASDLIL